MLDLQPQGGESHVTEAAQGGESHVTATETVTPKTETTPNAETIPQSEWQMMQENMRRLNDQLSHNTLDQFEKENPIVKNEKYSSKWEELKKAKKTPGHKYANLDWEDLLHKLHGEMRMSAPEVSTPIQAPQPMTVPSFNPSVSPDLPQGAISKEAKDFLSLRYTDDQIKSAEKAAS